MEEKHKGKALALLQAVGKYKAVLLVIAAGIVCLLWPSGGGGDKGTSLTENTTQSASEEAEVARLQEEMEEILGHIKGVGQLKLMLTVERGREQVLAGDSSLSYSGDTAAPADYSRSSETVVLSGDGGSVVVTQELAPRFRGALVVCEGAGDPAVQLEVIQAVSALTGLGSDKISVVTWQS